MQLRLASYLPMVGTLAGLFLGPGCVRKQYFQPDARPDAALSQPLPAAADSVHGATAGRQYARHGRLYQALVGRHHRPTWAAPVAVPVLRLAQAHPGGLRPGKVGGGFNSTSLNLAAADGQAYVLRTVDKDPIRATPKALRGTFLVNALRDNVSATHPYAALVVPPLATAVGVPRATPHLVYVRPDDPAFQTDSLRLFRGQLAYLEEKYAPSLPRQIYEYQSIINSKAAFEAAFANSSLRFDQRALLRARLLDGWLGDWDRHPGQWNWAVDKQAQAGFAALLPLPKDRDMVFYRLDDGLLGWLVGHLVQRHWVTFGPRFANISSLLSSGHYLDVRGLNGLSRAQFRSVALAMQAQLSDSLISHAVRRLPPMAFALEGPGIVAALQARRAALPALADAFYRELARRPRIGGTAQAERFEVHRYADSTVVAVYPARAAGGTTPAVLYHRAFFSAETRTIQLEGLGGDDVFVVENHGPAANAKPRLHIYGGPGTDELHGPHGGPGLRFWQGSASPERAYDKPPKE